MPHNQMGMVRSRLHTSVSLNRNYTTDFTPKMETSHSERGETSLKCTDVEKESTFVSEPSTVSPTPTSAVKFRRKSRPSSTKCSAPKIGRKSGSRSGHLPSERTRRISHPPDRTKRFSDVPGKSGSKKRSGNAGRPFSLFSRLNIEGTG